jgi:hypothetical protein
LPGSVFSRRDPYKWLNFQSAQTGERAAAIDSLIGTAKLNGVDPAAYLSHVLGCIADHPINQSDALLPWNLDQSSYSICVSPQSSTME